MFEDRMQLTAMPAAISQAPGRAAGPRALQDFDWLSLCEPASDWQLRLLDELDYGIVVLDWDGHVLYVNQAARAQLRVARALRIERGTLVATAARDASLLQRAVHAAAVQGRRRMVRVGTGAGQMELGVVPGPHCPGANSHRVMVMLSRQQLCEPLSTYGFARDHGLSPTETRVLQLLCEGRQPLAIAEHQGVTIATVRTQIASIRTKTDSANIGELIQRVARLPPIRSALQRDNSNPANGQP